MPVIGEAIAEGRASLHENLLPYAAMRLTSQRTTALSEPRRFFVLFIGALACIGASTSYVYNLFSGRLQEKYALSQSDMATITTLAGVLALVTLPLSSLYDYYGPQPLFIISIIAFPAGAVSFGLAFSDVLGGSVLRFTLFNGLLMVGATMFDIASLMTVMSIFPSSRGAVIAVMKTFIGLGSAIFGAIFLGFFEDDVPAFFYFMSIFVVCISVLSFIFIRLPPYQLTGYEEKHLDEPEKRRRAQTKRAYFEQVPPLRRFLLGFTMVAIFIVFLPTQSTLVAYLDLGHTYKLAFAIATIVLLALYGLVALPVRWLDGNTGAAAADASGEAPPAAEDADSEGPYGGATAGHTAAELLRSSQRVSAMIAATRGSIAEAAVFTLPVIDEAAHIAPQYQTAFWESVRTPELWALSYSLFCMIGAQMVIVINARFIYGALTEEPVSPAQVALLTVVNGVFSALGRCLMSVFEIWTQQREPADRIPLTAALFVPTAAVLVSTCLLLVVPKQLLLAPFVFAALGNGFTAATVVLVMRSLYARDMAMHYNCTSVAAIASSIVFNKLMYGEWYTRQAQKQGSTLCIGPECVFVPFVAMSVLLLSSFITNAFVHARYRSYCNAVLEERGFIHGGDTIGEGVSGAADAQRDPNTHGEAETESLLS